MDNKMFCFQCEQTAGCTGCVGNAGVCGKTAATAALQDELTGAHIGLAHASENNAKTDATSKEDLEILKLWESTYTKKEGYVSQWKQKRTELTEAVVAKYAALTEDEIKTLVVERKWLASVVGGCKALMQNVTHQIASDVTSLAERYEVTLGATESKVNDLEKKVLRSLKEMGFTL